MAAKLFVTLMIGALAAGAGHAAEKTLPQQVKEEVSDSSVTAKIKAEFARDKIVSATGIKVDTEDKGIVTLAGHAKNKTEADQAVKLARDISGVISVKNNIVVDSSSSTKGRADSAGKSATESLRENARDAVITAKIKAEFAKDKQVSAARVNVDTDDKGVVTLSGTAKSKAEAEQAVRLAKNTKGVTTVKNDIAVGAR